MSAPAKSACVFAQLYLPGLGDMVQRNIMLSVLRRAYPQVTLVVGPRLAEQFAELFARHSYATDVMVCPEVFDADEARWRQFQRELAERRFDLCLVDPGTHTLSASHARAAGIPRRLGYPKGLVADPALSEVIRLPRPLFGFPDLYEYADALSRALGATEPLAASRVVPAFPSTPEAIDEVSATSGPRVAVHAVGQPHWNRRWPLDRYVELGQRLVEAFDATVVLLGTSSENRELTMLRDGILAKHPAATVFADVDASLNRTANLLGGTDLFVGNDSGLAHVAAAVGTPSVVIYGPTGTELLWTRIYPHHRGVSLHYLCQAITHEVDQVAGRVCEYACTVEYQGPAGPYPRCLTDLDIDQVWTAVTAQLSAAAATGRKG